MHEAALATTVAATLREAPSGVIGTRVRVVVRGGHDEPALFDASFRLHLALAAPELAIERLDIVHEPIARLCGGCGRPFGAVSPLAACPTCDSPALPASAAEELVVEWLDGGGEGPDPVSEGPLETVGNRRTTRRRARERDQEAV